jgi:ribosome-associated translation inhibitor RaiA
VTDELARQVKRHRDKRRHRREGHAAASQRRAASTISGLPARAAS